MITTSSEWDSLSKRPGELNLVARLYYGNESNYLSIATKDLTIGSENFIGVVEKIPTRVQAVDMKTHEHSIGSFRLDINNLEYQPGKRFSDLLEELGAGSDIGFENRKADVRLYLDGITDFTNCFPFMNNAIIRDMDHEREQATIEIEDRTELLLTLSNIVEESDATSGSVMPEGSLGKLKQVVYGDLRFMINANIDNNIIASDWRATRENKLIPMIDLGGDEWLIAGHEIDNPSTNGGETIWAWDDELDRYIELQNWSIVQNTSDGCIISKTGNSFYDYRLPTGATTNGTEWSSPGNAADWDVDTVSDSETIHRTTNVDPAGTEKLITITFPTNDIDTADINYIRLYLKQTNDRPSEVGGIRVRLQIGINQYNDFTPVDNNTHYTYHDGNISTSDIESVDVRYEKYMSWVGSPEYAQAHIYSAFLQVRFTNTNIMSLYYGGRGRKYDTWVDGRSTAEGFTETHADDDNSGTIIENPAGVIESILRDESSLGNSEIDRDSFNVASNDISSLKFAFGITEKTEVATLLSELARECRSYVWWQPDGTFKMKTLEDTYSSTDRIINASEIKTLRFKRSNTKDIKTAVEVLYDAAKDRHLSVTPLSEDTTQQTKYNITQAQSKLSFESKYIHDSATAIEIRDYELAMWKQPHNIAEGIIGKEHLELDIGDRLQFTNVPYKVRGEDIESNVTRGGQTIYKYWWIFHVERGEKLKFKAIQLHNLT